MERSARVVSSVLEIEPPALIPQVRAALAELVEARVLADDVGKDVWQYAIGLARFDKLDIRERHLRWLIDKSYAQHALDTTLATARLAKQAIQTAAPITTGRATTFGKAPASQLRGLTGDTLYRKARSVTRGAYSPQLACVPCYVTG